MNHSWSNDTEKWQPINTAPVATELLFWWIPIDDNPYAETVVIGSLSSHEEFKGMWWNGQRGEYQSISHITHWMPLPKKPESRPHGKKTMSVMTEDFVDQAWASEHAGMIRLICGCYWCQGCGSLRALLKCEGHMRDVVRYRDILNG